VMDLLLVAIDAFLPLDRLGICGDDRNGSSFREDFGIYVVAVA
jgi:hypothetical protein